MDVDTNAGRGEQVIDHYLPGAVTNYGLRKKKLQKTKENPAKLRKTNENFRKPRESQEH